VAGPGRFIRGSASISRKLSTKTPTWKNSVRSSVAAKSIPAAFLPIPAIACSAAGGSAAAPARCWPDALPAEVPRRRHDAGVAVGSVATRRSCKQARKALTTGAVAVGGRPAVVRVLRSCGVTAVAAGPDWVPRSPKKITPITATPIEAPSWMLVLNTPEADPASSLRTPASRMSASGASTVPMPRPATINAGNSSVVVTVRP